MASKRIITWGIAACTFAFLLVIGLGAVAIEGLGRVNTTMGNAFEPLLSGSSAAFSMRGKIFELRNDIVQLALVRSAGTDESRLIANIERLDESIRVDLAAVKNGFPGDSGTLNAFGQRLDEWAAIRREIVRHVQNGDVGRAADLARDAGALKFAEIVSLVDHIAAYAQDHAHEVLVDADRGAAESQALVIALFAALIAAAGVVGIAAIRLINFEFRRGQKMLGELQESETKFRMLFESANDCLVILDANGNIVDINRTGHERLGYTKEEMVGKGIAQFDPPEFAAKVPERMAALRDGGQAVFESAHVRKDGTAMPVEINTRGVELCGEKRVFSIIRDITERKRMEQSLRESEMQYRAVVETSANGFLASDLNGRFLEVNDAYVRRSGYSREELLNMRIADVEAKECAAETEARIMQIVQDKTGRFETYHRAKDGSVWAVEATLSYWPIGEGRLFAFVNDITERKRIEEAILASERRYRSLFDNLLDGFAHLKIVYQHGEPRDLVFLEVNEVSNRLIGWGDVVGKTGRDVLASIRESNPELFEIACRVALGGAPERFETYLASVQKWFSVSVYSPALDHVVFLFEDVTERRRSEQMLRKRLSYLTMLANDIIYLTDAQGNFVDVNDRAIAAYGYSMEELSRMNVDALRAPVLTPPFAERQQQIEAAGAMRFESVHMHKDGKQFPVEVSLRLFEIDGATFVQSIVRDISERKLAEHALIEKERELAEAQRLAKIGSWTWDARTGSVYWSEELYRIFGYDPKLPLPSYKDHLALYAPPSRMLFELALEQALHSQQVSEFDLELNVKDGGPRWIAARYEPMRDAGGEIVGIRGIIQDISERKRQEEQVLAASKEIADLYNHAPCGYHSLDENGVFVAINDTELAWLGYRRRELIGKKRLTELLTPASVEMFNESFPRLKTKGLTRDIELELVKKDGGTIPVLVSASAIMDASGNFLKTRSTVYNMTERKLMEQERANYLRRLQQLAHHMVDMQEQERRWLSNELHDRNSANLAAITINLKSLTSALSPEMQENVADVLADTQALLEDTMHCVREVCMNLRPIVLDHAGLWPALEGYAQQFSRRTGIAVQVKKPDWEINLAPNVKSTLFRIAQEALTNCAKHAQATSIHIGLARVESDAVLTISDNGRGFDPDEFGQPGQAPGLGMITMRERAEFAGGRFSVTTGPGQGVHIRVEFPDNLCTLQ